MVPKLNREIDRRGFLKCMEWAGAAVIWSFAGGILSSRLLGAQDKHKMKPADFTFVQISDSHIGFNKPANTDVNGTLQLAVEQINAAVHQPDLILNLPAAFLAESDRSAGSPSRNPCPATVFPTTSFMRWHSTSTR